MKKFLTAILLVGAMMFNAASTVAAHPKEKDTLYQVALLQSLALGNFDGTITVKELKTYGDTGIGTFNGLDGEMIVLDGVVYRANQNCKVNVVADNVKIPFCNVAFFNSHSGGELADFYGKAQLDATLNESIRDENAVNSFYMVKISGEFSNLKIRSESKQSKPYPTLVEALEKTQKEFTHKKIRGTIVGLYCPEFMSSLNTTGWHFHFISEDKKIGGHVLDVSVERARFELDKIDAFRMVLPKTDAFNALDFSRDLKEDIRKAEHNSYR